MKRKHNKGKPYHVLMAERGIFLKKESQSEAKTVIEKNISKKIEGTIKRDPIPLPKKKIKKGDNFNQYSVANSDSRGWVARYRAECARLDALEENITS